MIHTDEMFWIAERVGIYREVYKKFPTTARHALEEAGVPDGSLRKCWCGQDHQWIGLRDVFFPRMSTNRRRYIERKWMRRGLGSYSCLPLISDDGWEERMLDVLRAHDATGRPRGGATGFPDGDA